MTGLDPVPRHRAGRAACGEPQRPRRRRAPSRTSASSASETVVENVLLAQTWLARYRRDCGDHRARLAPCARSASCAAGPDLALELFGLASSCVASVSAISRTPRCASSRSRPPSPPAPTSSCSTRPRQARTRGVARARRSIPRRTRRAGTHPRHRRAPCAARRSRVRLRVLPRIRSADRRGQARRRDRQPRSRRVVPRSGRRRERRR